MKTLAQLIDSLTLEQSRQYQAQTDKLIWIETELLDPAGLSRRHAEKVEEKLIDLLQAYNLTINREGYWQSIQALSAAKKTGVLYSDWHPVFGIL
jgi:hypothetical protein